MDTFLKKLAEVLGSQNALVTFISIALLGFTANDIAIEQTPEELIDLFTGKTGVQIVMILFLNFFNPLSKLVQKVIKKEFNFEFVTSRNFQTQVLSLITLIVSAFLDQALTGIVVTLVLQVWNLISHLAKAPKVSENAV